MHAAAHGLEKHEEIDAVSSRRYHLTEPIEPATFFNRLQTGTNLTRCMREAKRHGGHIDSGNLLYANDRRHTR